jgi:hypothetical protein
MSTLNKALYVFVCCLGLCLNARAEKAPPARILRVASTTEVARVAAQGLNNLSGRSMTKFLDQIERVQEVIRVSWDAPRGGWTGRTDVQLDYITSDSSDARGLRERHDRTTAGRHEAVFTIPIGAPVTAWSVRLLQGGRVLDEKSSGTWK